MYVCIILFSLTSIEKHISELLYEHDCVIIPAFGGFVCNYSSAHIHPSKHLFYPPFKKISFNRNLKNNDGLLANQISQQEKISYTEANQIIPEYATHLNEELLQYKRLEMHNIGIFYLGEEDTLLFEQDETVNYLTDSFGMSIFYLPPIKREPIQRKIEKQFKDKIIVPSKNKKEIVKGKKTTFIEIKRYVAVAASVILIASLIFISLKTNLLKNTGFANLSPFVEKEKPLYIGNANISFPSVEIKNNTDEIKKNLSNDTANYIHVSLGKELPTIIVKCKEEIIPAKHLTPNNIQHPATNHFHIIGGAFAQPENAERLMKKLCRKGYQSTIIKKKDGRFRCVTYGSFSTRNEALAELSRIRSVQHDAWLMKN
ncbi:MAG: SPOR domain-containing protein [Bacteroidota bacterium]